MSATQSATVGVNKKVFKLTIMLMLFLIPAN